MEQEKKPHFHGHRERLKMRFRDHGDGGLADYELLELILFRSIPRKDVKPIAKQLLHMFGSFPEILAAPVVRLVEIDGVGEQVALDLKIIEAAAKRFVTGKAADRYSFHSVEGIAEYCRSLIGYEEKEQFRILFLDKKNGLIADEVQQTGTVDHTPVYPREVVKRALELSATALILVHNHPSGDTTPSQADVHMTREIVHISAALGIIVHDHIIVGRHGFTSLKAMKLF